MHRPSPSDSRPEADFLSSKVSFGGTLCRKRAGRRARPLDCKRRVHFVLRSSKATGRLSMRHPSRLHQVDRLFKTICRQHGVKVHDYANAGNHLRFLVKIPHRKTYLKWIRKLTARLACLVTGSHKGKAQDGKFWDFRPFSRILKAWRGYRIANDDEYRDHLISLGVIPPNTVFLETG